MARFAPTKLLYFFRLVAGTGWGYLMIRCMFVTEVRPKHSSGLQDLLSYIALKSRVFNAMSVKFVGNLGGKGFLE